MEDIVILNAPPDELYAERLKQIFAKKSLNTWSISEMSHNVGDNVLKDKLKQAKAIVVISSPEFLECRTSQGVRLVDIVNEAKKDNKKKFVGLLHLSLCAAGQMNFDWASPTWKMPLSGINTKEHQEYIMQQFVDTFADTVATRAAKEESHVSKLQGKRSSWRNFFNR